MDHRSSIDHHLSMATKRSQRKATGRLQREDKAVGHSFPSEDNIPILHSSSEKEVSRRKRLSYLFLRGLSSLCFLPAHMYAVNTIRNDEFARLALFQVHFLEKDIIFDAALLLTYRYSVLMLMIVSLAWNNAAFAWPQVKHGVNFITTIQ